jgi:anti-anti-sigma factor
MSIIERHGDTAVITPQTDILSAAAARIKEELRELINDGVMHLTIDCSNVEMMDSLGVGLIIAAHNSLSKAGGALKLANAGPEVYDLLVSMRMNSHMEITPANHKPAGG